MLTIRIIPCLDIKSGRVVKGVKFVELRDAGDPVENAIAYAMGGADEITFLDITASSDERKIVIELVERVASRIFIPFTVGGGIRTLADAEAILHAGADKVSLNTAAFLNPSVLSDCAKLLGSQCIVCAIDVKWNAEKQMHEVYLHGGRTPTGMSAVDWARRACEEGAGEILLTSMDRDGTREGYDLAVIQQIRQTCNVPIIASGGAGTPEQMAEAIKSGADAVLAASIFHDKEYTVNQVKEILAKQGIPVRRRM